jgi:transcriptional regulator with XRE-family HTH domain
MAKNLVEALKAAIKASGLSHYRIAKRAGVAPALVDRFMLGVRDLRLATAAKIADALGLELVQKGKQGQKRRGESRGTA